MEVTFTLAFAAGFISFISPCVLPLVPAYITYMGGRVTNTVAAQAAVGGGTITQNNALTRISTGLHSIFFVLGFSLIFVGIGLLSTAFIRQVGGSNVAAITNIIGRAGGIVIIVFGLHFMDALSKIFAWVRQRKDGINILTTLLLLIAGGAIIFWAFDRPASAFATDTTIFYRTIVSLPVFTAFAMWLILGGAFNKPQAFWLNTINAIEGALYADTRQQMQATGNTGFGSSFLMGLVFAAGWTPCIGPIYGAILTLAANGGSIAQAGGMLTAYSLGLGIPFIATALMLDGAQGVLRNLNRHMRTVKLVSGIFLIAVGVLIASGQLQRLSAVGSSGSLGEISFRMEECFTHAVTGDVPWGQVIACTNGNYTIGAESESEIPAAGTNTETQTIAVGSFTSDDDAGSAEESVQQDIPVGTNVGELAPDFETFTDSGEAIALSDLRGQIVLVNFWATWCGPCRIEMPEFQHAFDEHSADGFTILAVNNRESASQVQDFRADLDLTFPMAMDLQGSIQDLYGIVNYPSTILVDADGVIIARHLGSINAEQINEMLTDALES